MEASELSVKGFRFAQVSAGLKKSGKPDLALITSDRPADCAAVFTRNKVVAAPVVLSRAVAENGRCQAVLVNSGNANACTGDRGLADARRCSELVAEKMSIAADMVVVASTGVIGVPLPMEKLERAIPGLPALLDAHGVSEVAKAMMTTDSFPKVAVRDVTAAGGDFRILGVAKGAGMIHPDMATMLAFVLTDAAVAPRFLQQALHRCVERSFNSITVDGDTSTNDMVLVMANGASGIDVIEAETPSAQAFEQSLAEVLVDLAKMIVRDGEGATKLVEIEVCGARDEAQARLAARSVATSSLVKTAFFGEDPNWGRIVAAVGYSGAEIEQEKVRLLFEDVEVFRYGITTRLEAEKIAAQILKRPEFRVTVDRGLGDGDSRYYTSDLTHDYVRINADYRT